MDVGLAVLGFCIGLAVIIKGGDWFVEAAVWMADATGIPKVVIGGTVVSLATTLPEFFVSSIAAARGHAEMAVGNAVGSVICNTGLILALSVFFSPIKFDRKLFLVRSLLAVVSLGTFWALGIDKQVDRGEALLLVGLLVLYIAVNLVQINRRAREGSSMTSGESDRRIQREIAKFIGGSLFIVAGARLLVDNGTLLAFALGIPEGIVSLTLIALGTSLPELATAVTALSKGHKSIAVGNVLGANTLNMTFVLGLSALFSEKGLVLASRPLQLFGRTWEAAAQTLVVDLPAALGLSGLVLAVGMFSGGLGRKTGGSLLALYMAYLALLYQIAFKGGV